MVENLGGILNPIEFNIPLVLHAQQTGYCFVFRETFQKAAPWQVRSGATWRTG